VVAATCIANMTKNAAPAIARKRHAATKHLLGKCRVMARIALRVIKNNPQLFVVPDIQSIKQNPRSSLTGGFVLWIGDNVPVIVANKKTAT